MILRTEPAFALENTNALTVETRAEICGNGSKAGCRNAVQTMLILLRPRE